MRRHDGRRLANLCRLQLCLCEFRVVRVGGNDVFHLTLDNTSHSKFAGDPP